MTKSSDKKIKEALNALEHASARTHAKDRAFGAVTTASFFFMAASFGLAIYADKDAGKAYDNKLSELGGHDQITLDCLKEITQAPGTSFKTCQDSKTKPAWNVLTQTKASWMPYILTFGGIGLAGFFTGCAGMIVTGRKQDEHVKEYDMGRPFRDKDREKIVVVTNDAPPSPKP